MGNRGDLTNEQWERLKGLLPPQKPKTGRPAEDHRQILNGMLWVLRTGAPWRDLPERYGKWTTIYSRFQRWRKSGMWERIFAHLQTQLEQESNVDWEIHYIDSTTVRAHQHAAGAKKVVPKPKH
jgi:transposase